MNIAKLKHYVCRSIKLGPRKVIQIVANRFKISLFQAYIRHQALAKKAHHHWHDIAKNHAIVPEFSSFLNNLKKKDFSFIEKFGLSDVEHADQYVNNCFDILGSGKQCFDKIPWHTDFRLQAQKTTDDVSFGAHTFYRDITIQNGHDHGLVKDIKVPWELSRFQYLVILGNAYAQTKNKKYAQVFVDHISDWVDHNPYLLGPNWVCPMDVALRAINWIIGFYFFCDAIIDELFWQRFVCSLYDHMIYLENNWELYDSITSNHYLSDLIGYFYLCYFFSDLPGIEEKTNWCYQELLREFDKQIFDEGTDYEGSTSYHKLVTEIFYHFYCLAEHLGFCVPDNFKQKLARMMIFIDWCTPYHGKLIQIGDNDSGSLISPLTLSDFVSKSYRRVSMPARYLVRRSLGEGGSHLVTAGSDGQDPVKHFPQFGLSIIKTKDWHISLRHAAYEKKQPTGHFHNDAASITLAINGIGVFADPGSYVYTPSTRWRNQFRSVAVHNTFFLEHIEPTQIDNRLFYMPLSEMFSQDAHEIDQHAIRLQTSHDLYARCGLRAQRKLIFNESEHAMIIQDCWQIADQKKFHNNLVSCWNFTLGPTITIEKIDDGLMLLHEKKPLASITSSLNFEVHDGWYSPSYGIKVPCTQLKACVALCADEVIINIIIF